MKWKQTFDTVFYFGLKYISFSMKDMNTFDGFKLYNGVCTGGHAYFAPLKFVFKNGDLYVKKQTAMSKIIVLWNVTDSEKLKQRCLLCIDNILSTVSFNI